MNKAASETLPPTAVQREPVHHIPAHLHFVSYPCMGVLCTFNDALTRRTLSENSMLTPSKPLITLAICALAAPAMLTAQAACTGESASLEGPYTSPPLLRNPQGMRLALEAEVREVGRVESEGGRPAVAFLVDADGTVRQLRIHQPSESPVTDSIAIRTARSARFYPAYLDRSPICKWVVFPIVVPPTGEPGGFVSHSRRVRYGKEVLLDGSFRSARRQR